MANNGSIASDDSYNYTNQDGFCHFDLSTNPPNIVNPWTGANTVRPPAQHRPIAHFALACRSPAPSFPPART